MEATQFLQSFFSDPKQREADRRANEALIELENKNTREAVKKCSR